MVIPRTRAHWQSIFSFIQQQLGTSVATYLQVIPGISKPNDGFNQCGCGGPYGVMSSACCDDYNSWRAIDGGPWWVRDSPYSEPNGDYCSNCFLGLYNWDINNLQFNDLWGGYSSGNNYLCSLNDV
jgi:hypothetical protein